MEGARLEGYIIASTRILQMLLESCSENVRTLFDQMNQPSATDRAACRILAVVSRDSEARRRLRNKPPQMIESRSRTPYG
jgi:hypothetical protein